MTTSFVAIAGVTGALGNLIGKALISQGTHVKGLVRLGTKSSRIESLKESGIDAVVVDFNNVSNLAAALTGATCVVSSLNGLSDIMIDVQSNLLAGAVEAKVPRFIPSDFSLDFTKTAPGTNRNLDFRRQFHSQLDKSGISWTSILNGAFMDMMTGDTSPVNAKTKKIMYIGDANQPFDYTSMEDIAAYTAAVATDKSSTPKFLRIAGDTLTATELAAIVSRVNNTPYTLSWMGSVWFHSNILIPMLRFFIGDKQVFPIWQGLQYLVNMASGEGKLTPLDNDRYPELQWTKLEHFIKAP